MRQKSEVFLDWQESLSENPRWSRQEALLAALPTLVDPPPELELSIAGAVSSLSRSIFVIPQDVPTLIPVEEIASLEPGHKYYHFSNNYVQRTPIASMDLGTSLRLSSSIQPSIFTSPSLHRSCLSISAANPPPSNASFPIFTTFSQRDFTCCRVSIKDSVTSMYENKTIPGRERDDVELSGLMALSPLDGRYWEKVKELSPFLSEYALIRFRVLVEVKWLLKLSQIPEVTEVPSFSEDARSYLEGLIHNFGETDAKEVKRIEKITNHDVKAVEYFLKQRCQCQPEIVKVLEFFHFACTSEDINNVAHALMLKEALDKVILPIMVELIVAICNMAKQNAHITMLSRTHGQPASPTSLGKEMAIFVDRLSKQCQSISKVRLLGKFAGAVGNYNAHLVAYPEINWPTVAEEFIKSLGIDFNPYVTQIEPHDYMGELFNAFTLFNSVLIDFDRDIWSYISLGYFKQITKAGEIGSSTMPHKVNPIDFENSEGNLSWANGNLDSLSKKLLISRMQIEDRKQRGVRTHVLLRLLSASSRFGPQPLMSFAGNVMHMPTLKLWGTHYLISKAFSSMVSSSSTSSVVFVPSCSISILTHAPGSRLGQALGQERDLTDSTVLRNMGVALGHCLLAYKMALQGIGKLQLNEARLNEDLDKSWEVLAEPIQTVMRRYSVPEPYEKLKELTRGRAVTKESIREFTEGLELPAEAKAALLRSTPQSYIGAAESLAKAIDTSIYSLKKTLEMNGYNRVRYQ
ncbi:hypothetical protein AAC387_Pa11g0690 [Persea americana]